MILEGFQARQYHKLPACNVDDIRARARRVRLFAAVFSPDNCIQWAVPVPPNNHISSAGQWCDDALNFFSDDDAGKSMANRQDFRLASL